MLPDETRSPHSLEVGSFTCRRLLMRKYFRLIAILILIGGVWMCYWTPIDYITKALGPIWSTLLGIVIIAIGAFVWKIKAIR